MPEQPATAIDKHESSGASLLRLIDPRLPLPWLIGAIAVAAGQYFKLQTLADAVVSLQIEVKAGNQSWATLAGEQALQKFRQGTAEEDIKALKAAVTALQSRK